MGSRKRVGFTLIELLIVVAIIAILAAIAVPNFLLAQTRAKVTRVVSDLRTVGLALEMYKVDYNEIPMVAPPSATFYPTYLDATDGSRYPGQLLTSPIAYMASVPMDTFNTRASQNTSWTRWGNEVEVSYVVTWCPMGLKSNAARDGWVNAIRANGLSFGDFFPTKEFYAMIESTGPDLLWWDFFSNTGQGDINPFFYDPTNGTVSSGQLVYLDTVGIVSPKQ